MDASKTKDIRRRLTSAYDALNSSIHRTRLAAEEIKVENTEDEGDLATISHDRDLLYNLHEGGFARMQAILEALKALDNGRYGECAACGQDINQKRLDAVPWATMCIHCQELAEMESTSSQMVGFGHEGEETE